MTDSLRDQLLGLGFKPAPKPDRKPEPRQDRRPDAQRRGNAPAGKPAAKGNDRNARPNNRPPHAPQGKPKPPRSREEMDLAKAYAIRAQKEKDERIEAERLKQEEARLRREAKAKVDELLKGKSLNDPEAAHEAGRIFGERDDLVLCDSAADALQGADALVVVTEWKQFRSPDFRQLQATLGDTVVFDGRNLYEPAEVETAGLAYYGIGRGRSVHAS